MIQLTELAREKLLEALKEQDSQPSVRVYIAGSG